MTSFYTPATTGPRPERSNVLPKGSYRVAITACEKKATKAGTGAYLQVEFTVLEGEHANRKVWERLNLWNPSATAVSIAREAMDELCFVTGKANLTSEKDMIGATLVAHLTVKQNRETKEPEQRIDRYTKDDGPGTVAAVKTAPAKAGAVPAWAAKSA